MVNVMRSDIQEAEYNPRKISPEAQRRLRRSLKKHKLVEPLVWNKRTGRLVGGHQRLHILDAATQEADYQLTVAAIDVDDEEEKKINVLLNQEAAMGEWDTDLLRSLMDGVQAPEEFGFDAAELTALLGDIRYVPAEKPADSDTIKQMKSMKNDFKKEARVSEEESTNYYAVLVFSKSEDRQKFCQEIAGDEFSEYVDGQKVMRMLGWASEEDQEAGE
jgi:hypothetical protein